MVFHIELIITFTYFLQIYIHFDSFQMDRFHYTTHYIITFHDYILLLNSLLRVKALDSSYIKEINYYTQRFRLDWIGP